MDSVCDAFLMEVPSLLTNLKQGAKQGDANKLRSASHTLKSCLRYFAPKEDVAMAAEVESAIQDSEWVESPESKAIADLQSKATDWVSRIRESVKQR